MQVQRLVQLVRATAVAARVSGCEVKIAAAGAGAESAASSSERSHTPDTSGNNQSADTAGTATAAPIQAIPDLPPFRESLTGNFTWGELSGTDFTTTVRNAYCEVVHWRRNLFLVPSGAIGRQCVRELTRLFNAYAQATALELVALEAIMVASCLLLQKPHETSKSKDHVSALERRLRAWQDEDVGGLMQEECTIQKQN